MLLITASAFTSIKQHSITSYPNECCGFILGNEENSNRNIVSIIACENYAATKQNSFAITARDYLQAEQFAEEKGLVLLGVYHSHPNCEALPSRTDLQSAMPNFSYLILSVCDNKIADVRSWRLNEQLSLEEENINIHNKTKIKKELLYGNRNYSYTLT